ncbi:MAG: 4-hydroxy-tetrahydrodipicolinate synthase [Chloroflexota bacterium]
MAQFGRLLTAMITPFQEDGEIDYGQARKLANALLDSGSEGLVIGGTTGESPSMSDEEKIRLFGEVKDAVGDRGQVIAGTSDNNHRKSIALTKEAERAGVDGIMLTVPAYNKPPQEGIYQNFKKLAEATTLPCILYNIPGRTGVNMTSDTTLRIAQVDNIVGVKEASSDPVQIATIIENTPDDFGVWSGNDDETFTIMAMGGTGVISVAAHVVGKQIRQMIGYLLEGEVERAAQEHRRLLPLFKALFWVTNPVPVKYAVNRTGFNAGTTRLPMVPMEQADPAAKEKLDGMLNKYQMDLPVS